MERRPLARYRLLAAGALAVTAVLPAVAPAQPVIDHVQIAFGGPPPGEERPRPGAPLHPARGDECAGPRGDGPGPRGDPMEAGMPMLPMVHGLDLSEAQQDKVFAVLHALAPAAREQSRALRRAHDELGSLARSVDYDRAQARQLAEAAARAQAQLALLRADAEHEIVMVLTAEQRRQFVTAPKSRPGPRP